MQPRRKGSIVGTIALVVGIAGLLFAWQQRFAIFDWWRLRSYSPLGAISVLADGTTMNARTRRLFYVYHPQLEDRADFGGHCRGNEQTIVLGCYVPQHGIYLYDVTDDRLYGVEQVTAAHETLHAAYDRLSSSDRRRIDELTAQALSNLADKRIKDTVEGYRKQDPSVVPSELHSILGTEVHDLPPELEEYYKRYFTNRAAIVAFSDQYEGAFTQRKQQVAAYDDQLKALKSDIDAQESRLQAQQNDIQADRHRLDDLLASKQYNAYNAAVSGYNANVRSFNAGVTDLQAKVDKYNQIVKARNAIALEEQQLSESLDSRLQTQSTQ